MLIQLDAAIKITANGETRHATVVAFDEIGFSVLIDDERYSLLWESLQDNNVRIELLSENSLKRAA